MGIKDFFNKLFSEEPDPLDDLLKKKGVDPKQLLINTKLKRMEEGVDNTVYRTLERCNTKQQQAGDKVKNILNN